MNYVKINENEYIKYDTTRKISEILYKNELLQQKIDYENNIAGLPEITDTFLLEWAKQRQPEIDEIRMKDEFEKKLEVINEDLRNLK